MIMTAKQGSANVPGNQAANDDQVLECLEWIEALQKAGFRKGELSVLAGYQSEQGLWLCVRRMGFPKRVHGELKRLYTAVTEDKAAVTALKQSARKLVKAIRQSGVPAREIRPVPRVATVDRMPPAMLGGIVEEPKPMAVRRDIPESAPVPASTARRRSESIWGLFEVARTGVGSAHRTIRQAKEQFGNPLTNAGLDVFIKRLEELDRDMARVLDACR